jgi:hypothetical protein
VPLRCAFFGSCGTNSHRSLYNLYIQRHKRLFAKDFLVRHPSVSSSPLATLCPVVPAPKETEEQSFELPTPPQTASWINPAYMRLENSNMSLTSSSSCSTCSLPPASSTSALGAAPLRRRRRVNGVGAAAFLLGLLVGGAHAFVPAYHRKLAAAAPCAAANNKRRAGGMNGHQSVTMSVGWAGTRGEVPKEGSALRSSR